MVRSDAVGDRIDVAATVRCTEAEGPYCRFALWVRGCSLRCPGCCNPELFERGATTRPTAELITTIAQTRDDAGIEGISVLGGEPLEQIAAVTRLAVAASELGLGVIVFTGYTFEEARRRPGFDRLWTHIDTLVDGRFDARARDPVRRFIGSTNQRLRHRTDRYADPTLWLGDRTVELRIEPEGTLSAHGDPDTVRRLLRTL